MCPACVNPYPWDPAGPYLDDPKVAKEFTDAYMEMVGGFLTFPLKFPGTAVWRAMQVRADILSIATCGSTLDAPANLQKC